MRVSYRPGGEEFALQAGELSPEFFTTKGNGFARFGEGKAARASRAIARR